MLKQRTILNKSKLLLSIFIFCILIIFGMEFSYAQITFQKTYGLPNSDENANSLYHTFDGGYIVAGQNYVVKIDSTGNIEWTKFINNFVCLSIQQTTDSGYVMFGSAVPVLSSYTDYQIIKTDQYGNIIWSKSYDNGSGTQDRGTSGCQTFDGGYVMTGDNKFPANNGSAVIRFDSNGDTLWTRKFYSSSYGSEIIQTSDSGFVVIGSGFWFIKVDKLGNVLWSKGLQLGGNKEGITLKQTSDEGFILGGKTDQFGAGSVDALLIKIDNNGNFQWAKTYGGTGGELIASVQQTNDNGYIFTGVTTSFPAFDYNILLVKTDSLGNLEWSKVYGGTDYEISSSLQLTKDNGYIIAGQKYLATPGSGDIYIIKTDSVGNSGCNEVAHTIVVSSPIINIGSFSHPVHSGFINTSTSFMVSSGGVVNTLCFNTGLNNLDGFYGGISVFPNPATNFIRISFEKIIDSGTLRIFNLLGECIFVKELFETSSLEIDVSRYAKGLYCVNIYKSNLIYTGKIGIQ